jgi:predicted MFS family arabinose efflux permease
VDFTGKRGFIGLKTSQLSYSPNILVLIANSLAIVGLLLLGLTSITPVIGLLLLGIHFSMMPAALWPSVPKVITTESHGIAFALISSSINLSLTALSPIAGYVADKSGFFGICLFFASLSFVATILTLIWNLKVPAINERDIKASSYLFAFKNIVQSCWK